MTLRTKIHRFVPLLPLFAILAVAGCLARAAPEATSPGGDFPLQFLNNSTQAVTIHLLVFEEYGKTAVYESSHDLDVGGSGRIDPIRLPHGDYLLRAEAEPLSRETPVVFDDQTAFFRFVVFDDVIAFKRGG